MQSINHRNGVYTGTYEEAMMLVIKNHCDDEIKSHDFDNEPMRRVWFKTKNKSYMIRLWSIIPYHDDKNKIHVESELFIDTCDKCKLTDCCCDEEILHDMKERRELEERRQKRMKTFETHDAFIRNMCLTNRAGKIYRSHLQSWLRHVAPKVFETSEEEYQCINKVGRGIWDATKVKNSFGKKDQLKIMEIADGYGAYDY